MGWWAAIPAIIEGISALSNMSGKSSTESNPYLQAIYGNLVGGLSTDPNSNSVYNSAKSYYDKVMDNDYRAITDSQMNRMYDSAASNLREDFTKSENNLAGRIARSGLSGSRIASKSLADQATSNNKTLANLASNLQNQNALLTNQNRQSALSMAPSLASSQYSYLQPWMSLGGLMSTLNNKSDSNSLNKWPMPWSG